jgi:DNA-binding beta-propeller fold protein YncE
VSLALCLLVVPLAYGGESSRAAPEVREAVEVQSILTSEFGVPRPAGLAYVKTKNLFFVASSTPSATKLLRLSPYDRARGRLTLPRLKRPSTIAFDPVTARLMAVNATQLVTVLSASLTTGRKPVARSNIGWLRLRRPQAVTFDPSDGSLLILDVAARQIVRVPDVSGRRKPTRISLNQLGARTFRGLAYNPTDRLVYLAAPDQELLYGLNRDGDVRKVFTFKNAALQNLTGIVFAPSSDPTDPPTIRHLFAADAGGAKALGRVVELALSRSGALKSTVTGRLARTIVTSKLTPPCPDPSGITYIPATDTLLVADSEVDEMPIFRGANLFLMSRAGALAGTGATLGFSREPSGLAFDSATSTLFVSDDDKRAVFIDQTGPDERYGTGDDIVARMSTVPFGSLDPEDVAFDPESGHLFVADGVGAEIYVVDPVDAVFGNGDVVRHFDVATYGVRNVEGLGYDAVRKTLLVVADRERRIFELTRAGGLVRIISVATIPQVRWLSDVTVAPTSNPNDSQRATSYFVPDREVDNNRNANENDGRIYEVVLP